MVPLQKALGFYSFIFLVLSFCCAALPFFVAISAFCFKAKKQHHYF